MSLTFVIWYVPKRVLLEDTFYEGVF